MFSSFCLTSSRPLGGEVPPPRSRLLLGEIVLCGVETADSFAARARGLLGRTGIDGVLKIPNTRSVHSFGMAFEIDVAFCDAGGVVKRIVTLKRNRITRRVRSCSFVLEAAAGSFKSWGVAQGDQLTIESDSPDSEVNQ